ncbi:acyl-CoA dehydrogenase family member 10 [Phyllostomus discolor]|uniref:Acyl-CoA dehydrogenase family member 10 n=1 Tax=Phyllostomus discolor TaxID=89673 RepID=A0A834DHS1_9CHIR|nr:acyl-CoA dehydrogenase family member 10 [Phyllostomus discolor]
MDVAGNKAAALDTATIYMVAPSMACRVTDRAIQAFGAAGLESRLPAGSVLRLGPSVVLCRRPR